MDEKKSLWIMLISLVLILVVLVGVCVYLNSCKSWTQEKFHKGEYEEFRHNDEFHEERHKKYGKSFDKNKFHKKESDLVVVKTISKLEEPKIVFVKVLNEKRYKPQEVIFTGEILFYPKENSKIYAYLSR